MVSMDYDGYLQAKATIDSCAAENQALQERPHVVEQVADLRHRIDNLSNNCATIEDMKDRILTFYSTARWGLLYRLLDFFSFSLSPIRKAEQAKVLADLAIQSLRDLERIYERGAADAIAQGRVSYGEMPSAPPLPLLVPSALPEDEPPPPYEAPQEANKRLYLQDITTNRQISDEELNTLLRSLITDGKLWMYEIFGETQGALAALKQEMRSQMNPQDQLRVYYILTTIQENKDRFINPLTPQELVAMIREVQNPWDIEEIEGTRPSTY